MSLRDLLRPMPPVIVQFDLADADDMAKVERLRERLRDVLALSPSPEDASEDTLAVVLAAFQRGRSEGERRGIRRAAGLLRRLARDEFAAQVEALLEEEREP